LVCIDISKDKFNACAISNPNSIIFEMFAHGLSSFTNKLSPFTKYSIIIAMESAVCYYFNLFSFLLANNFTCVVLSLWHQMMVTKNGSIPIWTTQSSHAQSVAPTTSTKKATTSVVQEHQSPFSVAWEEQRESKLSLLEDFFLLKRGLKNAKNLAKYIQGFCVVKNLWKTHNGNINRTLSHLHSFITTS
jgi:hypothetical protein